MIQPNNCHVYESDVTRITGNLWLGNVKSAYSKYFLKKFNIKHILTIMDEFDITKKQPGINHHIIPVKDFEVCSHNPVKLYGFTGKFIHDALSKGEAVLVHCKKGHHRSASVIVAYLFQHKGLDYETAVKYIHKRRPCSLVRETCMTRGIYDYYLHIKKKTCDDIKCGNTVGYYLCWCPT